MRGAAAAAIGLLCCGCIIYSNDELTDISPAPASFVPTVEQSVDVNFSASNRGGRLVTSNRIGNNINREILRRWQAAERILSATYVERGAFTGSADYEITLSGSLTNSSSSVWCMVLCPFTLAIVPLWSRASYDLRYSVREPATGRTFEANAKESFTFVVELFLVVAAPFAHDGNEKTFARLSDHLYQQLYDAGAFRDPAAPRP